MSKIGVTKIARKISKAGKNRGESLYANSQRTEIISWPDKPRKANSLVLWRIRTPRESERQRARANVRRAEVLDGVCVSMLAAARVPPSLWPPRSPPASPRAVWGSRTPGSGAGTLPLARNGGGFRQDVGPHFCGWGNRTVSARASGAERKPHNPRSESPFAEGISPLPAPWAGRQKAAASPKTDSSACRFRLRFSASLRGWPEGAGGQSDGGTRAGASMERKTASVVRAPDSHCGGCAALVCPWRRRTSQNDRPRRLFGVPGSLTFWFLLQPDFRFESRPAKELPFCPLASGASDHP